MLKNRSFLTKLMTTYLIVIVVTLGILFALLPPLFKNFYFRSQEKELLTRGRQIAAGLSPFLGSFELRTQDRGKMLSKLVETASKSLGARVCVVDAKDKLVAESENIGAPLTSLGRQCLIRKIEGGCETNVKVRKLCLLKESVVCLAIPIRDGRNNKIIGSLFIHKPLSGIAAVVSKVRQFILLTALAAVLLSAILGLLLSKGLSQPLKEMSQIAIAMASGDFDNRVKVETQDEIGQLGKSFNLLAQSLQGSLEALQKEKSKLQNVLVSMNEGVIAVDTEAKVIVVNPQVTELLQIEPSNILSKSISEDIIPKDLALLFRGCLKDKEFKTAELEIADKVILANLAPLKGDNEDIWGAVGVFRDISEAYRLEKMRRQFVADVSHELRTPLTSIRGFVEAILDKAIQTEEDKEKYLQVILQETIRLNRLISNLLDLSRMESGQLELSLKPLRLPELIEEVRAKLEPIAKEKRVSLFVRLPKKLPSVTADRDRISQVLTNLLSNAIFFNRKGGKVTIEAVETDNQIRVLVRDTGIGIPQEELPFVWERFYKADRARKRGKLEGGTGLGLAIVKSIIQAHRGEVFAESLPGEGSTFGFSLPKRIC